MALSIIANPINYQLSKNPIVLQLQTGDFLQNTPVLAKLSIVPSGTQSVGGTIVFSWLDNSVAFTIAVTPDSSGTQIRTIGALSASAYALAVIEDMSKNKTLTNAFNMVATTGGAYANGIWLVAKEFGSKYALKDDFTQSGSGFDKYIDGFEGGNDPDYAENYSMNTELYIEDTLYSNTFRKISEQNLKPDASYRCAFYLNDAIDSNLSYFLPSFSGTTPQRVTGALKRYYVRYCQRYGNPAQYYQQLQTTTGFALKAGVKHRNFATDAAAVDGLSFFGIFLTKLNRTKKVTASQKEYLYYITTTNVTYIGNIRIKAVVNFFGNKPSVEVLGSTINSVAKELIVFPVGFNQLNLGSVASFDEVKSYTVEVIHDSSGITLGVDKVTFYPDTDVYLDTNYFLFSNSLGALETCRLTGTKTAGFTIDKETIQKTILYDTPANTPEFKDTNHLLIEVFTIQTGFITKVEADWLQDLFVAESKYIVAESQFIPISIKNLEQTKYDSNTGKTSYKVDFIYATENPV